MQFRFGGPHGSYEVTVQFAATNRLQLAEHVIFIATYLYELSPVPPTKSGPAMQTQRTELLNRLPEYGARGGRQRKLELCVWAMTRSGAESAWSPVGATHTLPYC